MAIPVLGTLVERDITYLWDKSVHLCFHMATQTTAIPARKLLVYLCILFHKLSFRKPLYNVGSASCRTISFTAYTSHHWAYASRNAANMNY